MSELIVWSVALTVALALAAALGIHHQNRDRRESLVLRAIDLSTWQGRRWVTARDVQIRLGTNAAWIYAAMRSLERAGLLVSREEPGGPERGGRPRVAYSLAPPDAASKEGER